MPLLLRSISHRLISLRLKLRGIDPKEIKDFPFVLSSSKHVCHFSSNLLAMDMEILIAGVDCRDRLQKPLAVAGAAGGQVNHPGVEK